MYEPSDDERVTIERARMDAATTKKLLCCPPADRLGLLRAMRKALREVAAEFGVG